MGTFWNPVRIKDMTHKQKKVITMNLKIKKHITGGYAVIDLGKQLSLGSLGISNIPLEVFKTKQEAEKYIISKKR